MKILPMKVDKKASKLILRRQQADNSSLVKAKKNQQKRIRQVKRKLVIKKYKRNIAEFETYGKETFQNLLNKGRNKQQIKLDELYIGLQSSDFISSRLNYGKYDEANGVYRNEGSFGFCYMASPINGADEQYANQLMGLFALRWKVGATLSFCLYSSKELKSHFDWVVDSRANAKNPVCKEIAKNRVEHYKKGINKPLIKGQKFLVRDYRLVISVTFEGELEPEMYAELEMFKNSMYSMLRNLHMNPVEIKPDMLINILDELVNRQPDFKDTYFKYNPDTDIRDQITGPDTQIFVDKDGMAINNTIIRGC